MQRSLGAVCDFRLVGVCLSAGERHEIARAAGIMAAVTAGAMTDRCGATQRSGRLLAPTSSGGGSADSWKRHIIRQLKRRDVSQHAMFQDLVRFCTETSSSFMLCYGAQSTPRESLQKSGR